MEHFNFVQSWLTNSHNIKVSSEWLSACLEWIEQESGGSRLRAETVRDQVFEQWLTSDLSEIGEPSLPPNICDSEKLELVSNYALQLISVVDVGSPLYGQQQKLMGQENINESVTADKPFQPVWEAKPSRMLLLTLSDGHTTVKAMEWQPIRFLHPQMPSGTKCVLLGTVLSRKSVVLLTEDNLQVLGGEVDTLAEENSPLDVLKRNMTENRQDEGKHARQDFSGRFITRGSHKKTGWEGKPRPGGLVKKEEPGCSGRVTGSQIKKEEPDCSNRVSGPPRGAQMKEENPGCSNWVTGSQMKKEPGCRSQVTGPRAGPQMGSAMFKQNQVEKKELKPRVHGSRPSHTVDEWGDDFNYEDMDFDDFEDDLSHPDPQQQINTSLKQSDSFDEQKISDKLSDLDRCDSVKCKATIVTLIEKLSSNNGFYWSLACRVKDPTCSLDVDIANELLTELIGFSAEESIAMRQRFKSEPEVKEMFAQGLSQCQNKLISGRNGCTIEVKPAAQNQNGSRPVITQISFTSG